MADDARSRILDEAWGGTVLILSGDEIAAAFPGGFGEAAEWCAANGMAIAANGAADWTVERAPVAG